MSNPVQKKQKSSAFAALTSSETNEYYTPSLIINPVKEFYGGKITLDPCTCAIAQALIDAEYYWTLKQFLISKIHPLRVHWDVAEVVRVWLNPPYGQGKNSAKYWILKCIREYIAGRINEAVILVRGDSEGMRQLIKLAIWVELDKRVAFIDEFGKPTNHPVPGVRLFYLGTRLDEFHDRFEFLGSVCARRLKGV